MQEIRLDFDKSFYTSQDSAAISPQASSFSYQLTCTALTTHN